MKQGLRLVATLALALGGVCLDGRPASAQALSGDEQLAARLACAQASASGEAAAEACREGQVRDAAAVPRPPLTQLSFDQRMRLGSACADAQVRGPAELRRCQTREIPAVLAAELEPPAAEEERPSLQELPPARPAPAPPPASRPAAARAPAPAAPIARQPAPAPARQLVLEVQRHLARAGFYDGQPDGRFGPRTEQAIADFEMTLGRAPTGRATPELLQALRRDAGLDEGASAAPAPPEPPPVTVAEPEPPPPPVLLPEPEPASPPVIAAPPDPSPAPFDPSVVPDPATAESPPEASAAPEPEPLPPEPEAAEPPPDEAPVLPQPPGIPPAPAAAASHWPDARLLAAGLLLAVAALYGLRLLLRIWGRKAKLAPTVGILPVAEPEPPPVPEIRWHKPGQRVEVLGFLVPDGMVYVGSGGARAPERSLIDPDLPVAPDQPDLKGAEVPHWPAYAELRPHSRLAYLLWLSTGKREPGAGTGYVHLYLYGLERRFLLEDPDASERRSLVGEVERLRGAYAADPAFVGCATRFLDAAAFLELRSGELDFEAAALPDPLAEDAALPLAARVRLARKVKAGLPLAFEEALALHRAGTRLPALARRRPEPFLDLLRHRFNAAHPAGIQATPPAAPTPALGQYVGANRSIRLDLLHGLPESGLPDPAGAGLEGFGALVEEAAAELALIQGPGEDGATPTASDAVSDILAKFRAESEPRTAKNGRRAAS